MSGNDGLTAEDLRALPNHATSARFSEMEKAALDIAAALSRAPAEVSDALYAAARKWLSAEQMIELAGAVAWENFRARFNRAFDVEAAGFTQGGVCAIPEAAEPHFS